MKNVPDAIEEGTPVQSLEQGPDLMELNAHQLMEEANRRTATGQQYMRKSVEDLLRAGDCLRVAKEKVGHGNWGRYLKENWEHSERWAQILMKISEDISNGTIDSKTALSADSVHSLKKLVTKRKKPERKDTPEPANESIPMEEFRKIQLVYEYASDKAQEMFRSYFFYQECESCGKKHRKEVEALGLGLV